MFIHFYKGFHWFSIGFPIQLFFSTIETQIFPSLKLRSFLKLRCTPILAERDQKIMCSIERAISGVKMVIVWGTFLEDPFWCDHPHSLSNYDYPMENSDQDYVCIYIAIILYKLYRYIDYICILYIYIYTCIYILCVYIYIMCVYIYIMYIYIPPVSVLSLIPNNSILYLPVHIIPIFLVSQYFVG